MLLACYGVFYHVVRSVMLLACHRPLDWDRLFPLVDTTSQYELNALGQFSSSGYVAGVTESNIVDTRYNCR